jgi:hypothetical protein
VLREDVIVPSTPKVAEYVKTPDALKENDVQVVSWRVFDLDS